LVQFGSLSFLDGPVFESLPALDLCLILKVSAALLWCSQNYH
jgi:hypothetical protein